MSYCSPRPPPTPLPRKENIAFVEPHPRTPTRGSHPFCSWLQEVLLSHSRAHPSHRAAPPASLYRLSLLRARIWPPDGEPLNRPHDSIILEMYFQRGLKPDCGLHWPYLLWKAQTPHGPQLGNVSAVTEDGGLCPTHGSIPSPGCTWSSPAWLSLRALPQLLSACVSLLKQHCLATCRHKATVPPIPAPPAGKPWEAHGARHLLAQLRWSQGCNPAARCCEGSSGVFLSVGRQKSSSQYPRSHLCFHNQRCCCGITSSLEQRRGNYRAFGKPFKPFTPRPQREAGETLMCVAQEIPIWGVGFYNHPSPPFVVSLKGRAKQTWGAARHRHSQPRLPAWIHPGTASAGAAQQMENREGLRMRLSSSCSTAWKHAASPLALG